MIGKNMPYQLLESVNIIYANGSFMRNPGSDTDPGDIPELIKETGIGCFIEPVGKCP